MARKRRDLDGTEPLFADPIAEPGPMQQAALDALEKRRRAGQVDDDLVLQQLAVSLAAVVDVATATRDPYAASQPARELRDTWAKLTGPAKGGARDPFDEFLDGLGDGDGTGAEVRHRTQ